MSIRQLAQVLYQALRRVDDLTARLEAAPPDERDRLEAELNQARQEADRLRRMLDSKKEN